MAVIIAKGRYRLAETLISAEGYSAHKGIDIQARDNRAVLVNCYESPQAVKAVLPALHQLTPENMESFVALCVEQERLYAIFDYPVGKPLDKAYAAKEYPKREEAYPMAEAILHNLLLFSSLPVLVMSTAAQPHNVLVNREGRMAFARMTILPETKPDLDLVMEGISRCMEILFYRRFGLLDFELDFLDELKCGGYTSLSAMYSDWREVCSRWEKMKEKYEKMIGIKKLVLLVKQKWHRRKRAKAYRSRLEKRNAHSAQA